MRELHVTAVDSGEDLGVLRLADGVVTADTEIAQGVFDQYRRVSDDDEVVFDALATGWSNGYAKIAATR